MTEGEKFIDELWQKRGCYSNQEPIYWNCLKNQLPQFKGGVILEIGPGSGKFALQLINNYPITKYYILDIDKNINDSVNFLKSKKVDTEIIPVLSSDYKDLFGIQFDFIVSNICIPETPKAYREDLLGNIIPNAKSSMIIGQLGGWKREGADVYEDWIKGLFNSNFNKVSCEEIFLWNCYSLAGTNLQ